MSGKEIRANVDSENVKGLLLVNGGGVVALLAFLPTVLGKDDYGNFVNYILWSLLTFHIGLTSTLIHNHLRRRCSLAYDCDKPKIKILLFGAEPTVCHFSHFFMAISYLCFVIAGVLVFIGGMKTL